MMRSKYYTVESDKNDSISDVYHASQVQNINNGAYQVQNLDKSL
jgi:hypothetical protein